MTKFNVGDIVYFAKCNTQEITVSCPICYGKKEVTLILGNDDKVTLSCGYCGHGFDGPRGYIKEWDYVVAAELMTITEITIKKSLDKEKVEYRSIHYLLEEDRLFDNEKDALNKAQEIKAKLDEEQLTRTEYLKKDAKKSFAWNAGYHLREAKNHVKQAEYHYTKAALCKAKVKQEGEIKNESMDK